MNSGLLTLTNVVVGITCLISLLLMENRNGRLALIFHPVTIAERKQWYRFVTSGLIHADFLHLAINMFVLWSFGNAIEQYYYPAAYAAMPLEKYAGLYFGGIIVASIPSYLKHRSNPGYAALGASGGVSAVVFAAILFAPWQNLYLYGAIPLPQILAGAAYLYYSWYMDKKGTDNIGHSAHFAGAVWGFVYTGLLNPALFTRFIDLALAGPDWL